MNESNYHIDFLTEIYQRCITRFVCSPAAMLLLAFNFCVYGMEKSGANSIAEAMIRLKAEQTLLEGKLFLFGEGSVSPDYEKAYALFTRALNDERTAVEACYWLGYMHYEELGVEYGFDVDLCLHWFLRALDDRKVKSEPLIVGSIMYALGLMYKMRNDNDRAIHYFKLVYAVGDSTLIARAKKHLASLRSPSQWFRDGEYCERRVQRDYMQPSDYFELAASVECYEQAKAWLRLGNYYKVDGDFIKAKEFYEKAAAQEINAKAKVWAWAWLGDLFANGQGVEQDYAKARKWYEKCMNQDINKKAKAAVANTLGNIYDQGLGVQEDVHKAIEYYKIAAHQQKNESAMARAALSLSFFFRDGQGIQRDYTTARVYLEKAANQAADQETRAMAWVLLGDFSRDGNGVHRDYRKAKEFYEKAASQKINKRARAWGWLYLGMLFEHDWALLINGNDRGIQRDLAKAKTYFEKAAGQTENQEARKRALVYLTILELTTNVKPENVTKM